MSSHVGTQRLKMCMERLAFPLIYLYIEMGPNVRTKEPDIRLRLALQLGAK